MSEPKLLIIDGHSMAFRAFYALPPENFTTSTGQATNAVYGFTTMTLRMIEEHAPTHVAVAFDTKGGSFRNERYSEYKAGRAETPEEFKGQIGLIKQVLEAMGITWLTKEGFEADDILATLAHSGEAAGMRVLVASGDRDSFQLVTDKVNVIYPGRTPADLKIMDPQAVEDRYGVPPKWYPHVAALTGEKADNLPGVPGVGEKTAAQWVMQYGGLEGVLANAEQIKGKRGEALREHTPDVLRNRELNHLLTDVELPCEVAELTRAQVNRPALNELFDSLEFNRLRQRVFALDADSEISIEETTAAVEATPIKVYGEPVTAWTPALEQQGTGGEVGELVLYAEYAGEEIDALCLFKEAGPGQSEAVAFVIEPRLLDQTQHRALEALLNSVPLIVHEGKRLRHACRNSGLSLPQPADDIELAAYLCNPDQRSYQLADLTEKYLQVEWPADTAEATLFSRDLSGLAVKARLMLQLHQALQKQLVATELTSLYRDLELPVQADLYQLEATGIAMSNAVLQELLAELTAQVEAAQQAAFNTIGHEVNLASPMQLQTVLFEELQMPKTKKTKRGYTTNAEALADLYAKTQHPFLQYLLEHRDKIKLRQIVEGLLAAVGPDGRIHTTFQQTVAATGRLSSTEPNLQNIPARTVDGARIRAAFVPGEGFDALMTVDYSQIEMRLMAHMSADAGLIEAFNLGEDLHRTMASMVFGVPVEEVTSQLRSQIKATSYGLAYGLSSYGLSQQLGISVGEAAKLRDQYFERFGGVGKFLSEVVEDARGRGYTATLLGRRRYLPDLNASNPNLRAMAERAALNAPIQGTAADIIKLAMHQVMDKLQQAGCKSRVLLQVHDELVLEVVEAEIELVTQLVTETMGSVMDLSVPLEVSVGVGESWLDAAH